MVYRAFNADGEEVNIVEIMPEQIPGYEALTGLTLKIVESAPDPYEQLDPADMEAALNELGVRTRA